jgi:predicted HTH transcriptional regulator
MNDEHFNELLSSVKQAGKIMCGEEQASSIHDIANTSGGKLIIGMNDNRQGNISFDEEINYETELDTLDLTAIK